MRTLAIDIETYSSVSLADCGVYKYAESPDFKVLLFAYSADDAPVEIVDLAMGERIPNDILLALIDDSVTKTAFNATFERVCLSRFMRGSDDAFSFLHKEHDGYFSNKNRYMDPSQWECTMVASARMGLPLSLAQCGEVLGLDDKGEGKMKEGKALIRKFSLPNKNGERNLPESDPEGWETFKRYCVRDVEVEQAIRRKVSMVSQPLWEQMLYAIDQNINDRGVMIDREFVESAQRINDEYMADCLAKAKEITGLENPNSPTQLKEWILKHTGVAATTLSKKSLDDLEDKVGKHSAAYKVLRLRRELGKTSNKKYSAMLDCVCEDGRIHGLLQYYGAARTGRWAGRLVQVQNLPQNHIKDLDDARRLVKLGDMEELSLSYHNVTQTLSELIRTSFVAESGKTYHVCDFSAIEARVIAWLAGEEWVLEVFRNDGDIYCETASQMFKVKVEKHGENSDLRQKGKIAVLALGYGGGVPALEAFGAQKMGMTEADERDTVRKWREANPSIVRLWDNVERGAKRALSTGEDVMINRGVVFGKERGCLTVKLPSGRRLVYPRARVEIVSKTFGEFEGITYEGSNQTTKKWERIETYGGKMTENIVQAIARDILGVIMFRAVANGYKIVFHVHDEIIVEADPKEVELSDIEEIFGIEIEWAKGLPLKGAGYSTPYYKKD